MKLARFLASVALLAACSVAFGSTNAAQRLGLDRNGSYGHGGSRQERIVLRPAPAVWVPGHHEVRLERCWIPARFESVWIAPLYETVHDACGGAHQILVRAGSWKLHEIPGYYESRHVQVWIPGQWRRSYCN